MAKNEPDAKAGFAPGANPAGTPAVALSVRQPWAALLVSGLKTVEVRTWPTRRRGPVFIHAAKLPDDRPEAWALVTTPELRTLAGLRGGIIGVGDLSDCVTYATAESFAAAIGLHRNDPGWFHPGGLFGFVFENLRPVTFRACVGKTLFFAVDPKLLEPT